MLAYYQVGAFSLLLVGFAFGLVWAVDRTNKAALNWMLAHLALGFAVITGIRPADESNAWLDLIALLLTGLFLAAMYAALCNIRGLDFDIGHILPMAMGFALAISIIGFGYSTFAGHLFILFVLAGFFVWSGWVFLHKLSMPWVGLAFFLRSSSYVVLLTNGKFLFTAEQSLPTYVFSWSTAIFLGLVLIYVAVRQSRHRLEQIIRHLPDALLVKESDGSVLLCNQRFAELAGVGNPADLNGHPAPNFFADREQIEASLTTPDQLSQPLRIESEIRPEDGRIFPAEVIYSKFMDWGKPIIVTQIRDITERKAAEEERMSLLSTDQLTGLPNRQRLELQLNSLLWEQTRNHLGCAVMIISLNNFERISDAFGHAMGDSVLRETARILEEIKDRSDLLARIESNEFALIMANLNIRSQILQVDDLAKALTARLGQQIVQDEISVMLGTSIGIALSHPGDIGTAALLQRAQIAVHEAKIRGHGEWQFYDKDMDARTLSALKVESALRAAIANNELHLHYQPIVDAHSGKITRVEALARWNNPGHGNVSPATFIPIAEQSTLILDIGFWVMNEAIRQAASWAASESTHAPRVGINVSVRQFMHEEFENRLNCAVSDRGLSPSLIDLEITESLFASSDDETLRNKFDRLRSSGYGLSLDDFGTGYSSLSYLARFKLSAVKIDRSFVSGVDEDPKKRSIVRAIVSMSKSLGLEVIAEGVEREEERRILLDEGCDLLQGYLFSKPVAPDLLHFGKP